MLVQFPYVFQFLVLSCYYKGIVDGCPPRTWYKMQVAHFLVTIIPVHQNNELSYPNALLVGQLDLRGTIDALL